MKPDALLIASISITIVACAVGFVCGVRYGRSEAVSTVDSDAVHNFEYCLARLQQQEMRAGMAEQRAAEHEKAMRAFPTTPDGWRIDECRLKREAQ